MQAANTPMSDKEIKQVDQKIKTSGKADLVMDDASKSQTKKEKPIKKVSPSAKQTSVASSIFAKKTISTMTFDELKERKQELIKTDKKNAIKYLERMVPICNDLEELKTIMLELAQLLFDTEDYTKASKMYHEFTLLYPGCDEVEYAMFQAIISSFKLTLDAEHDQSKTAETRELAQAFLDRPSFVNHKKEVEEIAHKCDARIFESEVNIFNFYMKRGNYVAAKTRLSTIKETYLAKAIPDIQMRVAALETNYVAATINIQTNQKTVVAMQDKKDIQEQAKQPLVDRF